MFSSVEPVQGYIFPTGLHAVTSRMFLGHNSLVDFKEFPAACDICEKILDNEMNLKQHKKTEHTCHYVKCQCNECDFMAKEEQTLHVHFGNIQSRNNVAFVTEISMIRNNLMLTLPNVRFLFVATVAVEKHLKNFLK